MDQYEFFKQVILTDDGYVEMFQTTGAGTPVSGNQYDKISAITFDVDNKINVIVDDSAYTEAVISSQHEFWNLLKIVDGKIVVCTV